MTGSFTKDQLDEIKARVSLVDVVREVVALKRRGTGDWWGLSPFKSEKTPSFHVREDQGFYHCFATGAHGDVFKFVQETRGGSFVDAVEYLAQRAGIELQKQKVDPAKAKRRKDGFAALESAQKWFTRNLQGEPLNYLKKRGLSDETITKFQLGWAPDSWNDLRDFMASENYAQDVVRATALVKASTKGKGDYDFFRGRVMFPISDAAGKVIAFGGRILGAGEPKYLNSPETEFFNKRNVLYGLHLTREFIQKENQALLVEGYMDVVGLWDKGVQNAVAPMGTAVTEDQISYLWRYNENPIVCLDGDEAGQRAASRLAQRVLGVLAPGRTLRFALMPHGEDPDSYVEVHGKQAFMNLLEETRSLEDVLWADIVEGHDLQGGDGRAAVEDKIKHLTKQIQNDTVRYHYYRALKDRLWQAGTSRHSARNVQEGPAAKYLPSVTGQSGSRLLLGILLHKPELLPHVEEQLAQLTFEKEEETALVQTLFRALAEKGLEKEKLNSYLQDTGMKRAADKLLARLNIAKILEGENITDAGRLRSYWMAIFDQVQRYPRARRQKQALLDECADAVTSDRAAWERLVKRAAASKSDGTAS